MDNVAEPKKQYQLGHAPGDVESKYGIRDPKVFQQVFSSAKKDEMKKKVVVKQ